MMANRIISTIKECICHKQLDSMVRAGYHHSLRKMREELIASFGTYSFHQTINRGMEWGMDWNERSIENRVSSYSGYYYHDRDYIRINGKRCYRLAFFNTLLNVQVGGDYNTGYSFLKRSPRVDDK